MIDLLLIIATVGIIIGLLTIVLWIPYMIIRLICTVKIAREAREILDKANANKEEEQ